MQTSIYLYNGASFFLFVKNKIIIIGTCTMLRKFTMKPCTHAYTSTSHVTVMWSHPTLSAVIRSWRPLWSAADKAWTERLDAPTNTGKWRREEPGINFREIFSIIRTCSNWVSAWCILLGSSVSARARAIACTSMALWVTVQSRSWCGRKGTCLIW